jgi:hypothetical protein
VMAPEMLPPVAACRNDAGKRNASASFARSALAAGEIDFNKSTFASRKAW